MAYNPITDEEIASSEPVKTTTLQKLKGNFEDHEYRIQMAEGGNSSFPAILLRVNGNYSTRGAIDDLLKTTVNMGISIIGARILIDKAGEAGVTEVDIKVKKGDSPFESIFLSKPSISYSEGDDKLSEPGELDTNKTTLAPGDIIRLDLTSVQTNAVGFTVRLDWTRSLGSENPPLIDPKFSDEFFTVYNQTDQNKKMKLDVSAVDTMTTKTVKMANEDVDLADVNSTRDKTDDLVSLSGLPANSENLGTFDDGVLDPNLTVKEALQELGDRSQNARVQKLTDIENVNSSGLTNGDVLAYDAESDEWYPVPSVASVNSVNGQLGDVVLKAPDINRFDSDVTVEQSLDGLEAAINTKSNADGIGAFVETSDISSGEDVIINPATNKIILTNSSLLSISGILDKSPGSRLILVNKTGVDINLKNYAFAPDLTESTEVPINTGTGTDLEFKNNTSLFLTRTSFDDGENVNDEWTVVGGTGSGSGGEWGSITGTLSDQTDLQEEINNIYDAIADKNEFSDAEFRVNNDVDDTKQLALDVSRIAASTTRTVSVPNRNVNLDDIDINNAIKGDDSNAELSTGNWTTYADAAASSPVDGTGGSPDITLTRTTSSSEVLNGNASFKLSKDASNRQGEGASLNFTIDNALKNKPVKIRFNLSATSNFVFGSDSDIKIFIYDVTNSIFIGLAPNTLFGNGTFETMFQASSSSSYRLIFHVSTTNALAYDLFFDNVFIGYCPQVFIPFSSDWESYTPTFQGIGMPSGINIKYRRAGTDLLIIGEFTTGTTSNTEFRMSLPNNLLTKTDFTGLRRVGEILIANTNESGGYRNTASAIIEPGVNYLNVNLPGTSVVSKANGNVMANSTTSRVNVRVPIQGWTTGFPTTASVGQNLPVQMRAYKNSGSSTSSNTIASWTSKVDERGIFNLTTGQATIPDTGWYDIKGSAQYTGNSNATVEIRVDGTVVKSGDTASGTVHEVNDTQYLTAGQVVTLTINSNASFAANNTGTIFSIFKINTPQALMNIRKIAYVKDVKPNNTNGGTFTSGSFVDRTLNTIIDPYGITSLSSNQFTLQPGRYRIKAQAAIYDIGVSKLIITDASNNPIPGLNSINSGTSTNTVGLWSEISGFLTVTTTTSYKLRHRCSVTQTGSGFGLAVNFGVDEVYAVVEIEKLD